MLALNARVLDTKSLRYGVMLLQDLTRRDCRDAETNISNQMQLMLLTMVQTLPKEARIALLFL